MIQLEKNMICMRRATTVPTIQITILAIILAALLNRRQMNTASCGCLLRRRQTISLVSIDRTAPPGHADLIPFASITMAEDMLLSAALHY